MEAHDDHFSERTKDVDLLPGCRVLRRQNDDSMGVPLVALLAVASATLK